MALYSAGVEYGIHCLLFLTDEKGDSRDSSVRALAELQGVPQELLAKVFTKLAKAGLVAATEGVRGGFRLARPADEISVLDIVKAIDGDKLIFEPSRGGDLFPHLYGELPLSAVIWEKPLLLDEAGNHIFPELI